MSGGQAGSAEWMRSQFPPGRLRGEDNTHHFTVTLKRLVVKTESGVSLSRSRRQFRRPVVSGALKCKAVRAPAAKDGGSNFTVQTCAFKGSGDHFGLNTGRREEQPALRSPL